MRPRTRPLTGDGSTKTAALSVCTCPACHEDLIVTCPNQCPNAADGATGFRSPGLARPPRGPEAPARRRLPKKDRPRPRCARCGAEYPKGRKGRPPKVCEACETPTERQVREYRQAWYAGRAA